MGGRDMVACMELGRSEAGRQQLPSLLMSKAPASDEARQVQCDSSVNTLLVRHLNPWWMGLSQTLAIPAE